jgi:phosphorylase kinase alpha/beta subunit
MDIRFHNPELESLHVHSGYRARQVEVIEQALRDHDALRFTPLATGLYPASGGGSLGRSGYGNVWVRDNVFVAFAQWQSGDTAAAVAVAQGLLTFYGRHRRRFAIAAEGADEAMNRPHVRFDGRTLQEIPDERWAHAQNDALGYCMWLCAGLARQGLLTLDDSAVETLAAMAGYFADLRFWQDEDSGHWEETRKISASSIGTVVAGLREWSAVLSGLSIRGTAAHSRTDLIESAATSIARGRRALAAILPDECTQLSPQQNRRYDAALLFLIHPLRMIDGAVADLVLSDIRRYLLGAVGIRRYLRDSYWAPDYEKHVSEADRTRDYSEDIASRDRLLEGIGDEAQWCVFDPMLSALYGLRFVATRSADDREAQTWHFIRALAQITSDWRCPELYYRSGGQLVTNPHVPLLWTQANLLLALEAMRRTAD